MGYCYDQCLEVTTQSQVEGMTTQLAAPEQSQLVPHVVGTTTSFFPPCILMLYDSFVLWTTCCFIVYSQYIQHRYYPLSLCFTTSIHPLFFLKSLPKCNLSFSLRSQQQKLHSELESISEFLQMQIDQDETCDSFNTTC